MTAGAGLGGAGASLQHSIPPPADTGPRGASAAGYLKTALGVVWNMACSGEGISLRATVAETAILIGVAATNSDWRAPFASGRRVLPFVGREG